jgi:hypothetical protein
MRRRTRCSALFCTNGEPHRRPASRKPPRLIQGPSEGYDRVAQTCSLAASIQ